MSQLFTVLTTPSFNEQAFITLVRSWLQPLLNALLVIVPLVLAVTIGITWAKYQMMDENEQQQKPLAPRIMKMIVWAIVIESISAILSIFGFAI